MATIKFLIQSKKTNNSSFPPIYVRIRDGRSIDAKHKTGYIISAAEWDYEKGLPNYTNDNSFLVGKLNELRTDIFHHYNSLTQKEKKHNIKNYWLKSFFKNK